MMDWSETEEIIQRAWNDAKLRRDVRVVQRVGGVIEALDEGEVRVAEPKSDGWVVNQWVKQAVLLYFVHRDVEVSLHGAFEYRDKIPLKRGYAKAGVRVVPPATVRFGAYIGKDVVLMPSYVNIGAYVDSGTMVDTWATVGSCAQIGKGVHLSGGVGIGGVLEPVQASPVIIEDGAFIGSRCIVVEGVHVRKQAVLASGVVVTSSTPVIDVTGPEPAEIRGTIPERAVVVPGTRPKQFPAGKYEVQCALIIGRRKESTDLKTSLNEVLREYGIPT